MGRRYSLAEEVLSEIGLDRLHRELTPTVGQIFPSGDKPLGFMEFPGTSPHSLGLVDLVNLFKLPPEDIARLDKTRDAWLAALRGAGGTGPGPLLPKVWTPEMKAAGGARFEALGDILGPELLGAGVIKRVGRAGLRVIQGGRKKPRSYEEASNLQGRAGKNISTSPEELVNNKAVRRFKAMGDAFKAEQAASAAFLKKQGVKGDRISKLEELGMAVEEQALATFEGSLQRVAGVRELSKVEVGKLPVIQRKSLKSLLSDWLGVLSVGIKVDQTTPLMSQVSTKKMNEVITVLNKL